MNGNTYVLKERDARNVVVQLYVLDPTYVKPLVAPDGEVFYQLGADNLTGIPDQVTLPATAIIHDMMTLRHHHLCGLSPMAPASLAAVHGLQIQNMSTDFFSHSAKPSGIITAPGEITDANAALFDPVHDFAGSIAGIHEVLRRQGLLAGRWCLDAAEDLSPGQMADIDRVYAAYPHLRDDTFVAEHLDTWLR